VLPSATLQRSATARGVFDPHAGSALRAATDARDRHAGDPRGDARGRAGGEKQFVVFPTKLSSDPQGIPFPLTASESQRKLTSGQKTNRPVFLPIEGNKGALMDAPLLLPTAPETETFAGITYHIDGELVPVLTVDVVAGHSVYFEHHILLWKSIGVNIGLKAMKGAFKRMVAGMQVFTTEATGNGQIAFSRDGAGHIFGMHLKQGEEIHVREHQFLAATQNIDYTFERVKGAANMLFGGTGFFIDKFHGAQGDGILWLHGYGNVFEKVLKPYEHLDVEPGGWLYKDSTVQMETNIQRMSVGLLASMNLIMNRFTGPGRLGIQSMYLHMPTTE
jgi:uncharacterized protein (AIM24 family)